MKKLLIITDTYLPRYDGVGRFLSETLKKIHNFDIEIIAPDYRFGTNFKYEQKVTLFKPMNLSISDYHPVIPNLKILKKKIKEADLVFSHTLGLIGIFGSYYAKKHNKVLISFVHSVDWELISKALNTNNFIQKIVLKIIIFIAKWIYNKCNLILVPSKETENILVKQNINTPKRILHLGTNTNEFIPNKNIKKQKIKMKYDKNDFIIGYCGRISYEKDLLTLFEAYKDIKDSYPDHSIKLLIVGGGDKQLIEKIKQKDIFITGFVNNVIDYYQIMDIFVLPSLTETSSISTMEAMSCEIPVITTRVGFLNTYIKDGENGLHFKTKDKFELIEKLRLLIEDEKYRKKLSKNGRKTIVESYSWKETTSKLNRILNTIIQNIHEKAK